MANLAYGIRLTTAKPIKELESWMEQHCKGRWEVAFEGLGNDRSRKTFALYFEHEQDKIDFKKWYGTSRGG